MLGMDMSLADRDSAAAPARDTLRLSQLRRDTLGAHLVVQEHVASGARQRIPVSRADRDGIGRGAGIEEHQAARLGLGHDQRHDVAIGGHQAAHMVVEADRARHPVHGPTHSAYDLALIERDQQGVGAWIVGEAFDRLHGHVQQNLVAGVPRLGGLRRHRLGVRQERQSDGGVERDGPPCRR